MSTTLRSTQIALPLLLAALTLAGCQTPGLMATPTLYERGYRDPFVSVPPALQSNKVDVIYATDRMPSEKPTEGQPYGFGRSSSLAFGLTRVAFGQDVTWDQLTSSSTSAARRVKLTPTLLETNEVARFTPSNERLELVDGAMRVAESAQEVEAANQEKINSLLHEAMLNTDVKDVYLLVHGYNVSFQDAVFTIAQLWHFLGRTGVPVAYTWPAGRGGLRGYTTDRESGEFTIFHLKQFLRALAASPDVHRINIIGHSRGTDVVLTALRELHLELQGAGKDTRAELKLGNLILAAPDLDFEVVTQRVNAEGLLPVAERTTVYISPDDKAIGLSTWLFDSIRRIGNLRSTDLDSFQRNQTARLKSVEIIDAKARKVDFFGHSYFYQSPAVSSDLILILREKRAAGAENGRPLTPEDNGFWLLDNDYPRFPEQKSDSSAK